MKTSKANLSLRDKAIQEVVDHLLSLGAVPAPLGGLERRDFRLQTPAGTLSVHIIDNCRDPGFWIAQRFSEVANGVLFVKKILTGDVNPHSGKWNYHCFPQCPDSFQMFVKLWKHDIDCLMAIPNVESFESRLMRHYYPNTKAV